MQVVRNFFDSAVRFSNDHLGVVPNGALLLAMQSWIAFERGGIEKVDARKTTGLEGFFVYGMVYSALTLCIQTRLFSHPLDANLMKSIAARSAITTLDQIALSATVMSARVEGEKKAGMGRSLLGVAWLSLRFADIWKGENQAVFRLMHLDPAPAMALGNQIRGWCS